MFQPIDRDEARRQDRLRAGQMVVFVGRLERLKGVEVAIRALALLTTASTRRSHGHPRRGQ